MHKHIKDTKIHDVFNHDVQLPFEITARFEALPQIIADMPEQNRSKSARRRSLRTFVSVAAVVCVILLSACAAYIHDALFSHHPSLDAAQQSGYMQEVVSEVIVTEGIKTSVESVMMDEHIIVIVFNFELDEPIQDLQFASAKMGNLIITNESDDVIQSSNARGEYTVFESLTTAWGGTGVTEDNKSFRYAAILTGEYPPSKQLHITFDEIAFYGNVNTFWGAWDFTVQVPETAQQQTVAYVSQDNYDDVKVTSAELYPLSMCVSVEYQGEIEQYPYLITLLDEKGTKYNSLDGAFETVVRDGQTITCVTYIMEASAFDASESYVLEFESCDKELNNSYQFVLQKSESNA